MVNCDVCDYVLAYLIINVNIYKICLDWITGKRSKCILKINKMYLSFDDGSNKVVKVKLD